MGEKEAMENLYMWLLVTDIILTAVTVVLGALALFIGWAAYIGRSEVKKLAENIARERVEKYVQQEAPGQIEQMTEERMNALYRDMDKSPTHDSATGAQV